MFFFGRVGMGWVGLGRWVGGWVSRVVVVVLLGVFVEKEETYA